MLTFQAMSTYSAKQRRMGVLDHRWKWRLASPISSDPDIQKMLLVMHLISLQANRNAWEQLVHQPYMSNKKKCCKGWNEFQSIYE
jgi:hypothetical protein